MPREAVPHSLRMDETGGVVIARARDAEEIGELGEEELGIGPLGGAGGRPAREEGGDRGFARVLGGRLLFLYWGRHAASI